MGGHVRAVFTLVTFLFIGCVTYTISSFKEMPLKLLQSNQTRIMITAADEVSKINNSTKKIELNHNKDFIGF